MLCGMSRFLFCTVLLLQTALAGAANLTTAEAKDHIGETATVCGTVSGVHFAEGTKGQPTFISLDGRFPHNAFTILIWGSNRAAFGDLEKQYGSGHLCATGKIQSYRGNPEIVVSSRDSLKP